MCKVKILYIDCFSGFTSSMLLGALLDMGASESYIMVNLANMGIRAQIYKSATTRHNMECTYAYVKADGQIPDICEMSDILYELAQKKEDLSNDEICTWAAVISAIDSFDADYIMCSSLNEGICPDEKAIEILEKSKIYVNRICEKTTLISYEGALFLSKIINECGSIPTGDIKCVGYGAGDEEAEKVPNLVRTVLTATESEIELSAIFKELKL